MSKHEETTMVADVETPAFDPLRDIVGVATGSTADVIPTETVAADTVKLPATEELPADPQPQPLDLGSDQATITLPLGQLHAGYLSNHLEARLTSDRQRQNMRRILNGLRQKGAKLENGRFVDTQADAIRWVLEQVG